MKEKDMYLPSWILALGIFFIILACALIGYTLFNHFQTLIWFIIGSIICLGLGIAAVLCWKNQGIILLNDTEFEYSTMFGKRTVYKFSQIIGFKRNSDSITLLMECGKIHIESCAIISERLGNLLNKALENK